MGVIVFELLTGQPPFPGQTYGEVAHAVLQGITGGVKRNRPPSRQWGRIVHRALAREPEDRYANAEAMAEEAAGRSADGWDRNESPGARAAEAHCSAVFGCCGQARRIQFLAYSLPEAITVSLAGLENLVVRSSIVRRSILVMRPTCRKLRAKRKLTLY